MLRGRTGYHEATCDECMLALEVQVDTEADAREALLARGWTFAERTGRPAFSYCPQHKHADAVSVHPAVKLLLLVALAVGSWFLIQSLMSTSRMQDCFMSGRKNCAPIDTSGAP